MIRGLPTQLSSEEIPHSFVAEDISGHTQNTSILRVWMAKVANCSWCGSLYTANTTYY